MKKRSDEKTDEKMTGGDAASVREHVLSPEEYLSQIEFLDDDFEFQHKDGFEHVDICKPELLERGNCTV